MAFKNNIVQKTIVIALLLFYITVLQVPNVWFNRRQLDSHIAFTGNIYCFEMLMKKPSFTQIAGRKYETLQTSPERALRIPGGQSSGHFENLTIHGIRGAALSREGMRTYLALGSPRPPHWALRGTVQRPTLCVLWAAIAYERPVCAEAPESGQPGAYREVVGGSASILGGPFDLSA